MMNQPRRVQRVQSGVNALNVTIAGDEFALYIRRVCARLRRRPVPSASGHVISAPNFAGFALARAHARQIVAPKPAAPNFAGFALAHARARQVSAAKPAALVCGRIRLRQLIV